MTAATSVEQTDAPLQLSRLQGDAVISYALAADLFEGEVLVERIENTYVAFRRALEQMVLNTTCDCRACANIGSLDLKFFLHYGQFLVQSLGAHQELVGADVNLTFRLTKNRIPEETGIRAYVAYTEAAVEALGMPDFVQSLTRHEEEYPDVGRVPVYVQDMATIWEERKERHAVEISAGETMYRHEELFPVSRALLWNYITVPELRAYLFKVDRVDALEMRHGRRGEEMVYICDHGDQQVKQRIVDWHPYEQYAMVTDFAGATNLSLLRLEPADGGTRLVCVFRYPRGSFVRRLIARLLMTILIPRNVTTGYAALRAKIEADLEEQGEDEPAPVELRQDAVAASARRSLEAQRAD